MSVSEMTKQFQEEAMSWKRVAEKLTAERDQAIKKGDEALRAMHGANDLVAIYKLNLKAVTEERDEAIANGAEGFRTILALREERDSAGEALRVAEASEKELSERSVEFEDKLYAERAKSRQLEEALREAKAQLAVLTKGGRVSETWHTGREMRLEEAIREAWREIRKRDAVIRESVYGEPIECAGLGFAVKALESAAAKAGVKLP